MPTVVIRASREIQACVIPEDIIEIYEMINDYFSVMELILL